MAVAPTKRWKMPYITTSGGFPSRKSPTDFAEEAKLGADGKLVCVPGLELQPHLAKQQGVVPHRADHNCRNRRHDGGRIVYMKHKSVPYLLWLVGRSLKPRYAKTL